MPTYRATAKLDTPYSLTDDEVNKILGDHSYIRSRSSYTDAEVSADVNLEVDADTPEHARQILENRDLYDIAIYQRWAVNVTVSVWSTIESAPYRDYLPLHDAFDDEFEVEGTISFTVAVKAPDETTASEIVGRRIHQLKCINSVDIIED